MTTISVDNQLKSIGSWQLPRWRAYVITLLRIHRIECKGGFAEDIRYLAQAKAYICGDLSTPVRFLHYVHWAVGGLAPDQVVPGLGFLVATLRGYDVHGRPRKDPIGIRRKRPDKQPTITPQMERWLQQMKTTIKKPRP